MTAVRVLVCDDEPQILRALRVVLRDAGFETLAAETMEQALDAGADDYVTKPFSPPELLARLRAALRRAAAAGGEAVIRADDLELDLVARAVRRDGEDVHLTKTEFGLLRMLMVNRGRLLTHRALLTEVWGPAYADDVATLRTHMANLRRKIDPGGARHGLIRTESGVGYRFAG